MTDIICFHCQQAAEKYLKAYLVYQNSNFTKTHNLEILLNLCKTIDNDFENLYIGDLSYYAVNMRYPDDFYIPKILEAKEAFKITEKIREFVLNKIKECPIRLGNYSPCP